MDLPERAIEIINKKREEALNRLQQLLKIPSIAAKNTGAEEAIKLLEKYFSEAGFDYFIAETPGNPVFCAELNTGANKTLTFYDHYDVQPEDPLEFWESPPFEPTIKDGKIFARGVADNKGEIICRLEAIRSYIEAYGRLPINIKFIIEGEEEIGSPNLAFFVKNNKDFVQKSDGVIWEFGGKDKKGRQQITLGVKGILYLHLSTKTIQRDVHSGYTQFVDNAPFELVWALSSLKDRNDKILVPGFYDGVKEPTKEELEEIEHFPLDEEVLLESFGIEHFRLNLTGLELKKRFFLEPTCNICGIWGGYQGKGSKTITPNEAFAKVDFTLVMGQDPKDLQQKIRKYWDENNFKHIKIDHWDGYRASKTPSSHPFAQKIINVWKKVYQHDPIVWPTSGGSGPMYLFEPLPCVSLGTGHSDSMAHAPNENIILEDWYKGIEAIATLIHNF